MNVTSRYLERRYQALEAEFATTGDAVVKRKLDEFRDSLIAHYERRIAECDREIVNSRKPYNPPSRFKRKKFNAIHGGRG